MSNYINKKLSKELRLYQMGINTKNEKMTIIAYRNSYVVDEILKVEKSLGFHFSELQTKTFIENLGVKCNMYSVFVMKNEIRGEK